MKKRGQVLSVELLVALTIFFVIVVGFIVLMTWFSPPPLQQLETEATHIGEEVTAKESSTQINIAPGNQIAEEKVYPLIAAEPDPEIAYEKIRRQLNIKGDFCIFLQDQNGYLIPMGDEQVTGIGSPSLQLTQDLFCGQALSGGGSSSGGSSSSSSSSSTSSSGSSSSSSSSGGSSSSSSSSSGGSSSSSSSSSTSSS
ncbi:hypothetical protein J4460_07610, partial [Candidatus Woesearchaeota archaeon]|nr:hypothetical protein [Candidatus Woesearchaeota archaeon]